MNRRMQVLPALFVAVLSVAPAVKADVRLAKVFTDHMLLQRGLAAPVFGWAEAGEKVSVRFADQEKTATADELGRWIVRLDPLEASAEGRELTIAGANEIKLQDVLVGDVWICSGQSNMEWPMRAVTNADAEIAAAKYPNIRLFDVPGHTTAATVQDDIPGGQWQAC